MMGHRQVEQAALFYEFSLERHIPADHLLRSIDRFVDLEQVRQDLAPFYSSIGRPSIDPDIVAISLASVSSVASAQNCEAIPAGSAPIGLSRLYRGQSDVAVGKAGVQSDAARLQQITGTRSRSKPAMARNEAAYRSGKGRSTLH
jgi:hypothetical protein